MSAASPLSTVPPVQRKRTTRQIDGAVWLRPRDIEQAYGIDASMLCRICKSEDPAKRLPSVLIVGRSGKRGVRLVKRADLDAYLETRKAA